MRSFLPAELLGPTFPPFKNAVEVPSEATPIDRLVAWYGRRP